MAKKKSLHCCRGFRKRHARMFCWSWQSAAYNGWKRHARKASTERKQRPSAPGTPCHKIPDLEAFSKRGPTLHWLAWSLHCLSANSASWTVLETLRNGDYFWDSREGELKRWPSWETVKKGGSTPEINRNTQMSSMQRHRGGMSVERPSSELVLKSPWRQMQATWDRIKLSKTVGKINGSPPVFCPLVESAIATPYVTRSTRPSSTTP